MKTNRLLLTVLFGLLTFCNYAQVVEWANSHGYNLTQGTSGTGVIADASGNAYTIGEFTSDTTVFGTSTLVPIAYTDVYVAKTRASGNPVWAKRLGGTSWDYGRTISIDGSANIYVGGNFALSGIFGSFTLTSTTDISFVCKLDSVGNVLWAQKYGDPGPCTINNLYNDGSGDLYVSGNFTGTGIFGTSTLTANGSNDGFIAKLDKNNGNVLWLNQVGGTGSDAALSLTSDVSGNIYAAGIFEGNAGFGPYLLTSYGNSDEFIIKMNSSGTVQWAKKYGGAGYDYAVSLSCNATGKILFGGNFVPPAVFDTYTLSTGSSHICELDASGNMIWINKFEGMTGSTTLNSMTSDPSGNVYSTGSFQGTCSFGTNSLTAAVLTSNSTLGATPDAFFSKLDATGNFVWAKKLSGVNAEIGNSISYWSNKVYAIGTFDQGATIDTYTLTKPCSTSNAFLLKMGANMVGIEENFIKQEMVIYPNPTNGSINISLEEKYYGEVEIIVLDMLGREINSKKYSTIQNEVVDISDCKPGVYFLRVNIGEQSFTKKIIKN